MKLLKKILSLATLSLLMLPLSLGFSPLAQAEEAPLCNFNGLQGFPYEVPSKTNANGEPNENYETEVNNQEALLDSWYGLYDFAMESALTSTAENNTKDCGSPNEFTGYIEKGDCTAEGFTITEINEHFAGDTSLDDDNEIKTLYKGLCCLVGEYQDNTLVGCKDDVFIYTETYAECTGSPGSPVAAACQKIQWVIGTSGANIIKLYTKQLYIWGAGIVGFLAVIIIIISGVQISISGASGDVSSAKNRILQSLAGLALLFLSGLLLYTINPDFFGSLAPPAYASDLQHIAVEGEIPSLDIPKPDFLPGPLETANPSDTTDYVLNTTLPRAMNIVFGLMGIATFIGIVIASITMLTAYGNEDKLNRAKTNLRYGIIGFLTILLSYAIVSIVVSIALPQESFIPKAYAISQEDVDLLFPTQEELIEQHDEQGRVSLPSGDLVTEIVPAAISNIFFLAGLLIFIALMTGGTYLVIGRGNEDQINKAKSIITYSVIALALLSLGYAIVFGIATLILEDDPTSNQDEVFTNLEDSSPQ